MCDVLIRIYCSCVLCFVHPNWCAASVLAFITLRQIVIPVICCVLPAIDVLSVSIMILLYPTILIVIVIEWELEVHWCYRVTDRLVFFIPYMCLQYYEIGPFIFSSWSSWIYSRSTIECKKSRALDCIALRSDGCSIMFIICRYSIAPV